MESPIPTLVDGLSAWSRFAVVDHEGGWSVGPIEATATSRSALPRDLSALEDGQISFWRRDDSAMTGRYFTLLPIIPLVVTEIEPLVEAGFGLTVLHHVPSHEALTASRIRLDRNQPELRATTVDQRIVDINHWQMEAPSFAPSAWSENRQFGPFGIASALAMVDDDSFLLSVAAANYDNTMGGRVCLAAPDGALGYTDMGDGGLRVRSVAPQIAGLDQAGPIGRGLDADIFADPPAGTGDVWIELAPPAGTDWLPLAWPDHAAPYQGPTRAVRALLAGNLDASPDYTIGEHRSLPAALYASIDFMRFVFPDLADENPFLTVDLNGFDITDGLHFADAALIDAVSLVAATDRVFEGPAAALPATGIGLRVTATPRDAVRGQPITLSVQAFMLSTGINAPITAGPDWVIRYAGPDDDLSDPDSWPIGHTDTATTITVTPPLGRRRLHATVSVRSFLRAGSLELTMRLDPATWETVWSL